MDKAKELIYNLERRNLITQIERQDNFKVTETGSDIYSIEVSPTYKDGPVLLSANIPIYGRWGPPASQKDLLDWAARAALAKTVARHHDIEYLHTGELSNKFNLHSADEGSSVRLIDAVRKYHQLKSHSELTKAAHLAEMDLQNIVSRLF